MRCAIDGFSDVELPYFGRFSIGILISQALNKEKIVFNCGQKMALRVFYFTKALTYYYINRSKRHLLATIENN